MAIQYTSGVYISATSFSISGNYTNIFLANQRRVICDCGVDGIIYGDVISSSYSAPDTTVIISNATGSLTNNFVGVTVGDLDSSVNGAMPAHPHDGTGGSGNQFPITNLSDVDAYDNGKYLKSTASGTEWAAATAISSFPDLTDTPAGYDNGKYAKSTSSGIEWDNPVTGYATETYVDDTIATHSGSGDHDGRYYTEDEVDTTLLDYVTRDGSQGFTSTVSGINPEADADLATKEYVDSATTTSGHTEFGQETIASGTSMVSPTFAENFDDTTYALQITIKNTDDSPAGEYSYTITTKSTAGFTVTLSDNAETGNYVCEWYATDAATAGLPGVITHYQDFGAILTTNGTYKGDTMLVQVDDASTVFGNALYCAADFHYERADADSASTMPAVYLALQSGTGVKRVLIEGQICNTSWNWSAGLIYGSTTTGALTQTPPTGSGDQNQLVGWAMSANTMFFKTNLDLLEE